LEVSLDVPSVGVLPDQLIHTNEHTCTLAHTHMLDQTLLSKMLKDFGLCKDKLKCMMVSFSESLQ